MSIWTNKTHRTAFDDAEDLAYHPSGGPVKMWLAGVGVALIPLVYGIHCLCTGHARLFGGRSGGRLDLDGSGAVALAIAYVAIGVFVHFHYFWGLHPKLHPFSLFGKLVAVVVFLGGFCFAIYKVVMG